jgi:hypothetical protein
MVLEIAKPVATKTIAGNIYSIYYVVTPASLITGAGINYPTKLAIHQVESSGLV